jgi:hypothetical protein
MTNPESKDPIKEQGKKAEHKADKRDGKRQDAANSLNSDTAVPMLRFGISNNFDLFKRKVSVACQEHYKNLGRLITDEKYYVPPAIDSSLYDLTNDPQDIKKCRLREAYRRRDKEMDDMRIDRTAMFPYLISKLSKESLNEIQGHADWVKAESDRDPLQLWLIIKKCHQILMTSKVATVIKKTVREEYESCRQGPFEGIMDFKRCFDAKLDALKVSGNDEPEAADLAMDFLYTLDNSRYGEFKAEVINNMQKGLAVDLNDLNKMYLLASRRVVARTGKDVGGATFAMLDQAKKGQGGGGEGSTKSAPGVEGKNGKTAEEWLAAKLAKMKCFNCGEKGHPVKACPHKKKNSKDPPLAGMTLQACCATSRNIRLHEYYEVCLDNGSQVNIVDPRLLRNLTTSTQGYQSMNGVSQTSRVGLLEGFFYCQACDDCPTSILSLADNEDIYPVTYVQGESITVHMDDRDLVFTRRDKLYVADFSDWIVSDQDREEELHAGLNLMTVANRESMYSSKQARKALEAGEFLRALECPSEKEAVDIIRNGNVTNIPHCVDDVRWFFDIYSQQVPALRGKTMHKHPTRSISSNESAKQ